MKSYVTRILFFLLLIVSVGCQAQDGDGITRKVVEPDTDKDGRPNSRVETVYRDGKKVLMIWSKPDAQGNMTVTSRSYFVGGDMVTMELDEDRDGVFETVVAYRVGTKDMEVFTRQSDGSMTPVSAKALAAYKRQNAVISGFIDTVYDKSVDIDKKMELLEDARQEIQKAGKVIADDKK